MKYFTKEVCFFGINADKARCDRAEKEGEANYKKYHEDLPRVLSKIPEKYWPFFKKNAQLAHATVHQIIFGSLPKSLNALWKKNNFVEICVTHCEDGKNYSLKYSHIRKCFLDYPSEQPIYYDADEPQIGEWFTDELSMTEDEWLTHEIVFDSGATLYIEFEKFSYKCQDLSLLDRLQRWIRRKI